MEIKENSKSRNLGEKMGKRDIVKKENKENGKLGNWEKENFVR